MATYTEIQEQIKKLQEEAEKIRAGEIEAVIADLRSPPQRQPRHLQ